MREMWLGKLNGGWRGQREESMHWMDAGPTRDEPASPKVHTSCVASSYLPYPEILRYDRQWESQVRKRAVEQNPTAFGSIPMFRSWTKLCNLWFDSSCLSTL